MTPERWARISEVFAAALEKAPGERSRFLDEACGPDASLRVEVERLLAEPQDSWLKSPVESGPPPELCAGQVLGRYRVESKLGQGGMGAVYKAHDTVLRRPVALKVLPPGHLADFEHKQRLTREARAASALNHPNIVTIHDIGTENGTDFIAMELIEGQPLDRMIPGKGLPLPEALGLAVQIAQGMVAAHGAGIVHRDLKPANVMVTRSGLVKLLDFGLARRVEAAPGEGSTATAQGVIAGTVAYMSPEQAEGKPVDVRSDIFSFGSVLYEMVSGQRAFRGETQASTLAAVISQEPAALGSEIPRELKQVIARCLRKDPERRFQTMADLKVALEELKEDSDSGRLAAGAAAPARKGRRWLLLTSGAVPLLVLTGWLAWRSQSTLLLPLRLVPLTTYSGRERYPSFSPDGNQLAFSWDGEKQDNFDIYVKLIGPGAPLRLTTDPATDTSPAWSPDGRFIAFMRELPEGKAEVRLIPVLGGPERKLGEAAYVRSGFLSGPCLSWFPDGKWLVISDRASQEEPMGLFLLSVETGEKRRLTLPPASVVALYGGDAGPAVSPDGRTVVFSRVHIAGASDLYQVSLSEDLRPQGEPVRLTFEKRWALSPVWSVDGRAVIFSSGEYFSGRGLWRIAAPRQGLMGNRGPGKPERLASLGEDSYNVAISRQGRRLTYTREFIDTNIWRAELPGTGSPVSPGARSATPFISSTRNDLVPRYSPDGRRIAFLSDRSGNCEIWVCNSDGSGAAQLTSFGGATVVNPRWSPDGEQIVYNYLGGDFAVYAISASGGASRRLTNGPDNGIPSFSRDGRWIYFASQRSGDFQVWKIPAGGGEAVQVTRKGGQAAVESPDGKFLYYSKGLSSGPLWKAAVDGGEETLVVPALANLGAFEVVEDGVYFVPPRDPITGSAIWFLSLGGGKARKIASIANAGWLGLSVSPDRRWILYSQIDQQGSDLMLVEDFR